MRKSFDDALSDLLAEYADTDLEEVITALELQLMAVTADSIRRANASREVSRTQPAKEQHSQD